jgi:hypothetical protein
MPLIVPITYLVALGGFTLVSAPIDRCAVSGIHRSDTVDALVH